jgi:hypothetical protein
MSGQGGGGGGSREGSGGVCAEGGAAGRGGGGSPWPRGRAGRWWRGPRGWCRTPAAPAHRHQGGRRSVREECEQGTGTATPGRGSNKGRLPRLTGRGRGGAHHLLVGEDIGPAQRVGVAQHGAVITHRRQHRTGHVQHTHRLHPAQRPQSRTQPAACTPTHRRQAGRQGRQALAPEGRSERRTPIAVLGI